MNKIKQYVLGIFKDLEYVFSPTPRSVQVTGIGVSSDLGPQPGFNWRETAIEDLIHFMERDLRMLPHNPEDLQYKLEVYKRQLEKMDPKTLYSYLMDEAHRFYYEKGRASK